MDGGNSFAGAGELAVRSDEYIWKVDHKLANHTEYEAIVLTDTLEGIQAVDPAKVKVFGYDGADITSQGKTAVADKGGKKVVTWTWCLTTSRPSTRSSAVPLTTRQACRT